MNIFETITDRVISSELRTHRVVQGKKIAIFATFCGHLGFLRKMKKCEYLGKGISSPVMHGAR